ncbi:MAG: carbamoyltransferase [Thermodesulfobacteriota bacterium]|nr:carbamoyltransferase [Thermodesulfobacteriota bacterium]
MLVIGISAYYHDSAACVIRDGKIIAAVQEERFTRIKHDSRFPEKSIIFCLEKAQAKISDVDYIAFYEKPGLKFDRLLKTYLMHAPLGLHSFIKSMSVWLKHKLWIENEIRRKMNFNGKIIFPEHHESHSASAFYPSPFNRAAILTMDGVGEWTTTSFGLGEENRISLYKEIRFPHSLGLLYSAFTYFTGFKVNSGEYKLMGLAPYGDPVYVDLIYDKLIDVKEDGSFRLNMEYFNYCTGFTMTNKKFDKLFGRGPREQESEITQLDMDLARSVQVVTEEIVLRIGKTVYNATQEKNLCLAGGVALNCVANGRLYREGPFERIWIQPAAGDAGGALGAALYVWHNTLGNKREADDKNDFQKGTYLGTEYSDGYIRDFLESKHIPFIAIKEEDLSEKIARPLAEGHVIGWFQGRMEFGPRALGARSILGDARSPEMQSVMNLKIKYRESFRPFAPAVLSECSNEWFDMQDEDTRSGFSSPYMLMVTDVKKDKIKAVNKRVPGLKGLDLLKAERSDIPAVTHVDNSARIQTVHSETNPLFHSLIEAFYKQTGCPVIINTSFNVRGEPIVESPEDAYRCFMRTEMDYLVLGTYLLDKKNQPEFVETKDWMKEFQLD